MRSICLQLAAFICFYSGSAQLPFKYDNTSYKAIYLNQVSKLMDENPGYILLDVRTPGEYSDTSNYSNLNMGRLKGARNIDIDSISSHLEELKKDSDKAFFIYCSHSQRSRRVSKLLSENGFKKVFNINGGMSVVNEADNMAFPDKNKFYISNTRYVNISATPACELILHDPDLLTIDIRSKSQFESNDPINQNNIGRIKNAVNIPASEFDKDFTALQVSKSKKILIYDQRGSNSAHYAATLIESGYQNVYNLFEGIANLETDNNADANLIRQVIVATPQYKIIGVKHSIQLMRQNPDIVILDTRPAKEFENKSEEEHLNLGHMKNSIHIDNRKPDDVVRKLDDVVSNKNKQTYFLVYGSGPSAEDHSADVCKKLTDKGYKNVYLLYPGLYRFVWSTTNIESCRDGHDLLSDHDGLY